MSNTYETRIKVLERITVIEEIEAISSNLPVVTPRTILTLPHDGSASLTPHPRPQDVQLRKRAVQLVEEPCRRRNIDIQLLGEFPLFEQRKIIQRADRLTDFVIMPAEQDPLIAKGNFPAPKAIIKRIKAIEKAGVPMESLHTYVAHEVPRNSVSLYEPIPLWTVTSPPPQHVVRLSERLGTIAITTFCALLLAAALPAAILALPAATLALPMVAAGVDPVIFACYADERGMATWFLIAQWSWE